MRLILLTGAVLIALLAYSVYEPMPDYVLDWAFLSFGHSVMRVLHAVGKFTELAGLAESEVVRRLLFGLLLPPPRNTSGAVFTYRRFADSDTLVTTPARPSGAAVIYFHGGGWAVGSPEMFSEVYAEWAEKTGVTIYAVRYRLAPEHPFPAAFDDCLSATQAIFAEAESLGLDPSRVALTGDSAGGQLTASVAQQLRRLNSPHRPKLQLMVYPVTQVLNLRTDSVLANSDAPILKVEHLPRYFSLYLTGSSAAYKWIWRHGHVTDSARAAYERATGQSLPALADASAASAGISASIASHAASIATDFRVSPLLGDDLEKLDLPPAHILACEFDPLLDDALMYADRLRRAGVRTQLRKFRTYHAAMSLRRDGLEIRAYLTKVLLEEL